MHSNYPLLMASPGSCEGCKKTIPHGGSKIGPGGLWYHPPLSCMPFNHPLSLAGINNALICLCNNATIRTLMVTFSHPYPCVHVCVCACMGTCVCVSERLWMCAYVHMSRSWSTHRIVIKLLIYSSWLQHASTTQWMQTPFCGKISQTQRPLCAQGKVG